MADKAACRGHWLLLDIATEGGLGLEEEAFLTIPAYNDSINITLLKIGEGFFRVRGDFLVESAFFLKVVLLDEVTRAIDRPAKTSDKSSERRSAAKLFVFSTSAGQVDTWTSTAKKPLATPVTLDLEISDCMSWLEQNQQLKNHWQQFIRQTNVWPGKDDGICARMDRHSRRNCLKCLCEPPARTCNSQKLILKDSSLLVKNDSDPL